MHFLFYMKFPSFKPTRPLTLHSSTRIGIQPCQRDRRSRGTFRDHRQGDQRCSMGILLRRGTKRRLSVRCDLCTSYQYILVFIFNFKRRKARNALLWSAKVRSFPHVIYLLPLSHVNFPYTHHSPPLYLVLVSNLPTSHALIPAFVCSSCGSHVIFPT